jgi:hypothetical protein
VHWAPSFPLVSLFILRLMVSRSERSKPWKKCCVLVYCLGRVAGKIILHWQSLLITTATRLVSRWHHLRLYMAGGVSPLCARRPWERDPWLVLIGLSRLQRRFGKFVRIFLAAQSRQKSYADVRRRVLEFAVGDQVLLRVSPTKGVVWFGVSGKLSPRYIGPFTILARMGSLAYCL